MILTFIILAVTIILFISDKLRIDIVAMLSLLALTLTGIIDANQALAGFANSTVITIAGLFVVGAGLFRTGVADWLGEQLLRLAGASETRLLVVLIATMLPMSTALQITGGAEFIANSLVNTLGVLHPLFLLAGMFLLTTAFTQVISNTATTVLVVPIALQAATDLSLSPQAVLMMVAVGASTAFLTPIASPVNTLVLTPGGYRFGDFIKAGLPLLLLFLAASVVLVPLIWVL